MALRTGISIIAGSSAVIALGFVLARWGARTGAGGSVRTKQRPTPRRLAPVGFEEGLAVDGGVSARPTERWQEAGDGYDAANPDDLGAEYLARAVQVPRETDELTSDLDASGMHVELLEDDDLEGESIRGANFAGALSSDDIEALSTLQDDLEDDYAPDSEDLAFAALEREDDAALDRAPQSEPWYAALREPRRGSRRV